MNQLEIAKWDKKHNKTLSTLGLVVGSISMAVGAFNLDLFPIAAGIICLSIAITRLIK